MSRLLKDLTLAQLRETMKEWGEARFRADQIYEWCHKHLVTTFSEMTQLPLALRQRLTEEFTLEALTEEIRQTSQQDGTTKYLFRILDGWGIEAVWMSHHHGNTVCISSQVGCKMGCTFCASTLNGCVRNLSAGKMVHQIIQITRRHQTNGRVRNVVVMGTGEPLENLEHLLQALTILNSSEGLNIGYRHITVSTCGIIPGITELASHKLSLTLSVSLHATTNEVRNRLVPMNRKYPIETLLTACREYQQITGRRITYEYALIDGVNAEISDARALALLLSGMGGHVNLISLNPVIEKGWLPPSPAIVSRFRDELERAGIAATIRRSLGGDIDAACGQLRRRSENL